MVSCPSCAAVSTSSCAPGWHSELGQAFSFRYSMLLRHFSCGVLQNLWIAVDHPFPIRNRSAAQSPLLGFDFFYHDIDVGPSSRHGAFHKCVRELHDHLLFLFL